MNETAASIMPSPSDLIGPSMLNFYVQYITKLEMLLILFYVFET